MGRQFEPVRGHIEYQAVMMKIVAAFLLVYTLVYTMGLFYLAFLRILCSVLKSILRDSSLSRNSIK